MPSSVILPKLFYWQSILISPLLDPTFSSYPPYSSNIKMIRAENHMVLACENILVRDGLLFLATFYMILGMGLG